MTTINCSSNCIHQQDGKCMLDNPSQNSLSAKTDCVFFEERVSKKNMVLLENQPAN